jgi:hypothetical protein
VLIMHGLDDTVVPVKHARELHRVAWDSRLVGVPDAGHSLPHDEEYWGRVRGFLVEAHVIEAGAIDADVSDADEIGPGVIEADGIEAP